MGGQRAAGRPAALEVQAGRRRDKPIGISGSRRMQWTCWPH
jgi:hypothetical protein